MSKNQKRAQRAKTLTSGRNEPYMRAEQERRRSNAAGSHRMATDYRRRPKHAGRGWE